MADPKAPPKSGYSTMVDEMRSVYGPPSAQGPRPKEAKPTPTGKRFTWSAPIVSPQAGRRTDHQIDMSGSAGVAPRPDASSRLTPATFDLRKERGKVAAVRAAKKVLK